MTFIENQSVRQAITQRQQLLTELNRDFPGERKKRSKDRDPSFNQRRDEILKLYAQSIKERFILPWKGRQTVNGNPKTANNSFMEGHHKVYRENSPILNITKEHILGGAKPSKHGLVLQRPGENMPYASIRPPYFRSVKNDPQPHPEDLVQLFASRLNRESLIVPKSNQLTVGSELEVLTLHEEVRNNGHERIVPNWTSASLTKNLELLGVMHSPEVWNFMMELNGAVSSSTTKRRDDFINTAKKIARVTNQQGFNVRALPVSSQPYVADKSHINPHPYVQRMVLDYLTFGSVEHLGASFQVHIEMLDINSAIYTVNNLRKLPYLFMAMSLNGPFLQHKLTDLLSCREQARKAMQTGGTLYQLPEWEDCLDYAIGQLMSNDVPSLPRALSQHRDFRIRPDITPHGTIEFMFLDNPGGHIEKMIMFQEILRLSTWRTYHAYKNNEELPEVLFGGKNDDAIDINKAKVSRYGSKASIFNGQNRPTSAENQLEYLLAWIKDNPAFEDNIEYPLSKLKEELEKSLSTPQFSNLDSCSMARYYQTGEGTPGHYQRAFCEYLMRDRGLDEVEAINMALMDYADSYLAYIQTV